MTKDKQIEEIEIMAAEIDRILFEAELKAPYPRIHPSIIRAKALYNAGYRKASEIFEEIEQEIELALDCNYKVKRDAQGDNDTLVIYVDGKIDCLRGLAGFIAELKKKYTEGKR